MSGEPTHAWCETIAASGCEHLRKLTDVGVKLGGGCDTMALCGLKASWDLRSPVTEESVSRERKPDMYGYPCTACVARFREDHRS